jgi:hypothetical protein
VAVATAAAVVVVTWCDSSRCVMYAKIPVRTYLSNTSVYYKRNRSYMFRLVLSHQAVQDFIKRKFLIILHM